MKRKAPLEKKMPRKAQLIHCQGKSKNKDVSACNLIIIIASAGLEILCNQDS